MLPLCRRSGCWRRTRWIGRWYCEYSPRARNGDACEAVRYAAAIAARWHRLACGLSLARQESFYVQSEPLVGGPAMQRISTIAAAVILAAAAVPACAEVK